MHNSWLKMRDERAQQAVLTNIVARTYGHARDPHSKPLQSINKGVGVARPGLDDCCDVHKV
jgi:hypothetical protein